MSALPKNAPRLESPALATDDAKLDRLNWVTSAPFVLTHVAMLGAFFIGFRWEYVVMALVSYYVRMFGVTAGYHRYFSHRAFKTNRVFQFFLAFLAQTSIQKGVLWWAANHRHHHRYSDQEEDIHSPTRKGFWFSHMTWIMTERYEGTDLNRIKDFARFPELRFLNKYHLLPALMWVPLIWALGGIEAVMWVGVIPTVLLWHGTFTINSLSHIFGSRRYLTTDTSRNNWLLALITCGEGWHNNHHFYQNTASQGWFWWEVDFTFYVLKVLSWVGLVTDLRMPAEQTRQSFRKYTDEQRAQLRGEVAFHSSSAAPAPTPPAPERQPMPSMAS